ncbi:MAG: leucine-rich repeat domain-containing protein [Bacteroidia bacterium]|nr:leucine-rich repeat domain-containing protein [Bacteroidia bacterium]
MRKWYIIILIFLSTNLKIFSQTRIWTFTLESEPDYPVQVVFHDGHEVFPDNLGQGAQVKSFSWTDNLWGYDSVFVANMCEEDFLKALATWDNLESLYLKDVPLTKLPDNLHRFKELKEITLIDPRLKEFPAHLPNLKKLTILCNSGPIPPMVPPKLPPLHNLEELSIGVFNGPIPVKSFLPNLKRFENLRSMCIRMGNDPEDREAFFQIIPLLKPLKRLEKLTLDFPVDEEILAAVVPLLQGKELEITDLYLPPHEVPRLKGLSALTIYNSIQYFGENREAFWQELGKLHFDRFSLGDFPCYTCIDYLKKVENLHLHLKPRNGLMFHLADFPGLKSLRYDANSEGYLSNLPVLNNVESVEHLGWWRGTHYWKDVWDTLARYPNLRELTIDVKAFKYIPPVVREGDFPKLEQIKVEGWSENQETMEHFVQYLNPIAEKLPKVKFLYYEGGWGPVKYDELKEKPGGESKIWIKWRSP